MSDRKILPEDNNLPNKPQQSILDNTHIEGSATIGNIDQSQNQYTYNTYAYFSNLAGFPDSQPISLNLNSPPPQYPPLLFKLLLEIDFKKQMELVEKAASKHQTLGFLVHGAPEYGQEILISQIHRNNISWKKNNPININVAQNGIGNNISNLWVKTARSLELPFNSNPSDIFERICERLTTQDVILIFSSVDYMQTQTLAKWLKEFWKPLVKRAEEIQPCKKKQTHLLMFLVDYGGNVPRQLKITVTEKFDPLSYDPYTPLCLPGAECFTLSMLEDWLKFARRFCDESSMAEKLETLSANDLHQESIQGTPQYVVEKICEKLGESWEGGLAKWLI